MPYIYISPEGTLADLLTAAHMSSATLSTAM